MLFLKPLSWIYGLVVEARNFLFDQNIFKAQKSKLPAICVGNVVVGGSGKSIFVQYLAKKLFNLGYQPVILLRGYKGKLHGPIEVTNSSIITEVGDEALMHLESLKNIAKVVISKDRFLGTNFIEKNNLGNIIILDDGMQHRKLSCNKNILLLDISDETAINKWRSGDYLPSGFLRESLVSALKRTNLIVYMNKTKDFKNGTFLDCQQTAFQFKLDSFILKSVQNGKEIDIKEFNQNSVIAISSIANPKNFFNTLNSLGLNIEKTFSFPDHYNFTKKDFEKFAENNSKIICSTKDLVKLYQFASDKNFQNIYYLSISGSIIEQEEVFLNQLIP